MDENVCLGKKILAIFFFIFILCVGIMSNPLGTTQNLALMLGWSNNTDDGEVQEDSESEEEENITMNLVNTDYVDSLWNKSAFIDLNGSMAKLLGMKGYYSSTGIYVTDNDYIVSGPYAKTSTDYEIEQIQSLKEYLDEKDIKLLYVNAPIKYIDDTFFENNYGIASYSNRNADLFLERLDDLDISYIDLRDEAVTDNKDMLSMFYRTDHHWTVDSGLWASGKIADGLNQYCGYNIDTSIYDSNQYQYTEFKDCWLGEQGRKLSASYIGLDDFTEIKPTFETSLVYTAYDGTITEGSFDILVDEESYYSEKDVYSAPSWHYSYMRPHYNNSTIHNNNVDNGKVLVLGDSYSQVVIPFLSLGVSDVYSLLLRNCREHMLRNYIDNKDIDTVVIVYAQFMIGAHDNPDSANYRMFEFE